MTEEDTWEVVIGQEPEAILAFGMPESGPHGELNVSTRILASGLSATTVSNLEDWGGGRRSLPDFFRLLAGDWRGWTGAREWADDGGQVQISATHDGKCEVVLAVSVAIRRYRRWRATAQVPVEPGALEGIANSLLALCSSRDSPRR